MAVRVIGRQGALFHLAPESGSFTEAMQQLGHMPLPPYIERADSAADRDRYQTVYAKTTARLLRQRLGCISINYF